MRKMMCFVCIVISVCFCQSLNACLTKPVSLVKIIIKACGPIMRHFMLHDMLVTYLSNWAMFYFTLCV